MVVLRGGTSQTMTIAPEARSADDLRFPNLSRDIERQLWRLPRDFNFDFEFDARGFGVLSQRRLGITVTPLSDQLATYFGVKQGLLVSDVAAGSAGEAAGIKAGDVITMVAGQTVSAPGDLSRELRDAESGTTVEIRVMRERKEVTLMAKIPERARANAQRSRAI
jgi:S1-C subfamily serine protease